MDNLKIEISKKTKNFRHNWMLFLIISFGVLFVFIYFLILSPKRNEDVLIHISPKDSLIKVSNDLKEKEVVRHPFLFKIFVRVLSGDKNVSKGDYLFKKGENLFGVVFQIVKGNHNVNPIKVTLREGINKEEMAKILADKIKGFNKDLFLNDERSKEGYLFPDTYFFYSLSTTNEILDDINSNFNRKINSLDKDIKSSGKSLSDIMIMASILEKEASGKEDIGMISGILWKRIKLGMPLQVDVAPITYKEIGLPDSPIGNPGFLAIYSTLHPVESGYLFYLHDENRQVHYAVDFSEHRSNIAKYLK
ncbi:MAG: endolytic transglycosylase MltG [Candidatus Paceibacterota bacterium]